MRARVEKGCDWGRWRISAHAETRDGGESGYVCLFVAGKKFLIIYVASRRVRVCASKKTALKNYL